MSNFVSVTYDTTRPVGDSIRRPGRREPVTVRVDVSNMAVATAARAGFPAYTYEGRVQLVRNLLSALGITMDPSMEPILYGKRTLANRGFTATVWVQA